jgi:translation initiation factor 1
MAKDRPVYSTDKSLNTKDVSKSNYTKSAGPTKMRLETAGRGGKAVTVLFNLPFSEEEARFMMKEMQSQFGCGATLKNSTIELRGDVKSRVEDYFAKKQLKIVRAGG